MKVKTYNGELVEKADVVDYQGKIFKKKDCKQCHNCKDHFMPDYEKDYQDQIYPVINDMTFCCKACVIDAGITQNLYGDPVEDKSIGQIDFFKHRGGVRVHRTTHAHPYLIGFEVEKEDDKYYSQLMNIETGLKIPPGWICMKDSSLKNSGGFEMISPAYNLTKDMDMIKKHLKDYQELMSANYSQWCGGHISVSKKGLTGNQLANRQKPLLCFFLTLFPARLRNINVNQYNFSTCQGTKKKHKPFVTEPNGRFELRMPSAVKSSKQLLRRIKTLEWFLTKEPSFASTYFAMKNKKGVLRKLYSPVYGYERWNEFIERFSKMSLWFCKGEGEGQITNYVNRDEME